MYLAITFLDMGTDNISFQYNIEIMFACAGAIETPHWQQQQQPQYALDSIRKSVNDMA